MIAESSFTGVLTTWRKWRPLDLPNVAGLAIEMAMIGFGFGVDVDDDDDDVKEKKLGLKLFLFEIDDE
jgi:hypothetical protein